MTVVRFVQVAGLVVVVLGVVGFAKDGGVLDALTALVGAVAVVQATVELRRSTGR